MHRGLIVLEWKVLFNRVALGFNGILYVHVKERAWSALTSSDLVELLLLIFCLLEKLIAAPFPRDIIAPE
jgi:hypothetical protein